MRDSFIFYRSFGDAARTLADEDRLKLFDALISYALDDEAPELDGPVAGMMMLMMPVLDSNAQRASSGQKGAEHGSRGGRPKKTPMGLSEKTPMGLSEKTPMGLSEKTPNKEVEEDKELDKELDKEREEDEDVEGVFVLADGSTWYPDAGKVKEFGKAFPDVNIKAELLRCAVKHNSTDQRKNVTNIEKYVVNWLLIAQGEAKKARSGTFTDIPQREPVKEADLMKELRGRGNLV